MREIEPKLRDAALRALRAAEDALEKAQRAVIEARKLVDDAWTKDTPRPRTAWCPVRPGDVSPLAGLAESNPTLAPLTEKQKAEAREKIERVTKRYATKRKPFDPRGRNR